MFSSRDDDGTVIQLQESVREFVAARSWEQYHDSKNLAMAIASEAGELCSVLRWTSLEQLGAAERDPIARERLSHEIGDIGILLFALCNRLGLEFASVIRSKLVVNDSNYPAAISRGHAERPKD